MLEPSKTYEEAKWFLIAAVDDDYQKLMHKVDIIRLIVLALIDIGIAAVIAALSHDKVQFWLSLPSITICLLPFGMVYFRRNSTKKQILNGKYFEDKSEFLVIYAAREYAKDYNEWEAKRAKHRKQ